MWLYNKYVLPKVVDWACRQKPTRKQRMKIIPEAKGNVLEIGIGTGLNLPFYDPKSVQSLVGIDPSVELWNENNFDTNILPFNFSFINAKAENIPLENGSIDSIVITYTLCSITKTEESFDEIRRVLKPNGHLIFCEHGMAPDKSVQQWQNLINPLWKTLGGGCTLNKNIPHIIETNGFILSSLNTMYIPGWKPASYNYWGIAKLK